MEIINNKDRITLTYEILSRISYLDAIESNNFSLEKKFNGIEELLEKKYLKKAFPMHNVRFLIIFIFFKLTYTFFLSRILVKII